MHAPIMQLTHGSMVHHGSRVLPLTSAHTVVTSNKHTLGVRLKEKNIGLVNPVVRCTNWKSTCIDRLPRVNGKGATFIENRVFIIYTAISLFRY